MRQQIVCLKYHLFFYITVDKCKAGRDTPLFFEILK